MTFGPFLINFSKYVLFLSFTVSGYVMFIAIFLGIPRVSQGPAPGRTAGRSPGRAWLLRRSWPR